MELSVYHLAIITVIASLFFSLVLLCHTIMNKPPNSTGGGGVASRVGTGSKKGSRAKALYAEVLI